MRGGMEGGRAPSRRQGGGPGELAGWAVDGCWPPAPLAHHPCAALAAVTVTAAATAPATAAAGLTWHMCTWSSPAWQGTTSAPTPSTPTRRSAGCTRAR